MKTAFFGVIAAVLALGGAGCATPFEDGFDPSAADLDVHALDAELMRLERRGMVGQVLVAQHGKLLYGRGIGRRSPDQADRVRLETVFPLASLTKPFTAAAVLALVADGRITLDDPLGAHLTTLTPPWADLPIESLLTHTSGVSPEITNPESPEPRFEPIPRDELITRVQQFQPAGIPGTTFRYSNVGYGLLGALIETVSGESWESYLRTRLLAPSGLQPIGFVLPSWTVDDIAVGRVGGDGWGTYFDRPALGDGAGFNLRASGDLHAPANVILDWWRQLRAGTFLPPDAAEEWLRPRVREPDGSAYGYGWQIRDTRHGRVIGHTGGDRVYAVDFSWYPDRDVLVYIATANARFEADVIRDGLHARLFDAR